MIWVKSRAASFKHLFLLPLLAAYVQFSCRIWKLFIQIWMKVSMKGFFTWVKDCPATAVYCTLLQTPWKSYLCWLFKMSPCCSEVHVAIRCDSRCNKAYFWLHPTSKLEMCLKFTAEGSRRLLYCLVVNYPLKQGCRLFDFFVPLLAMSFILCPSINTLLWLFIFDLLPLCLGLGQTKIGNNSLKQDVASFTWLMDIGFFIVRISTYKYLGCTYMLCI